LVADTPIDQIKTYLRWHLLHAYAGTSLPESFDSENWNFYSPHFERRREAAGAMETLHPARRYGTGRGAWPGVRAKYFPPAEKQRALEMATAIEQAMDKDIAALDWMSAATKVKAKENCTRL